MGTQWVIDAVRVGQLDGLHRGDFLYKDRSPEPLSIPLIMFVLRSHDRTVVVDTGGPVDEATMRGRGFAYRVTEEMRPEAALARLGVDPASVDTVVNTHLHWDHCSNNDLLPNAEILVQRAELAYAIAPVPAQRGSYGILPGVVPAFAHALDRVRALDGGTAIAPGLEVVPLPGHTPGSQGVRVETGAGTHVITGDCVDTFENWDHRGSGAPHPSGRYTDLPAFQSSLERLRGTGWIPLPSHDHTVVEQGTYGY